MLVPQPRRQDLDSDDSQGGVFEPDQLYEPPVEAALPADAVVDARPDGTPLTVPSALLGQCMQAAVLSVIAMSLVQHVDGCQR